MKLGITSIALLATLSLSTITYAQTNQKLAQQKGDLAVEMMDKGQIDESIKLLKEAQALDPLDYTYPYEMAYAYYLKKDYKSAADLLNKIKKDKGVQDIVYQLLGNCYDMMGEFEKAIKTYDEGLHLFPNSGKLYYESGVAYLSQKNYEAAVDRFKKGITVEPTHPSNYYLASVLYLNSEEEVWGMLYGETLMNLEPNSKRSGEVSQLLFETYKSEIQIKDENNFSVSFSQNIISGNEIPKGASIKLPFGMIYEQTLMLAAMGTKSINIASLNTLRTNFIKSYYQNKHQEKYQFPLFTYQKKVLDAGHMEAYNYWILRNGNSQEFKSWKEKNNEKFEAFMKWYRSNPIEVI